MKQFDENKFKCDLENMIKAKDRIINTKSIVYSQDAKERAKIQKEALTRVYCMIDNSIYYK